MSDLSRTEKVCSWEVCAWYIRSGGAAPREGARRGVERRERMKRGSGMKGRDERSRGMEIRIAETCCVLLGDNARAIQKTYMSVGVMKD